MRKSRTKRLIKQTELEKRLFGVHMVMSGGKVDRTVRPTCLDLSGLTDEDKGLNIDYHRPPTPEQLYGVTIRVTDEDADTTVRPHKPAKPATNRDSKRSKKQNRKSKGR
jgi:hypothetical protein